MITQRQALLFIASRIPFTASALSAYSVPDGWRFDADRMAGWEMEPSEFWALRCYLNGDAVDYVVLSYSTPIAYHTRDGEWIVCKQKHSATTSRHTRIVKQAITDNREG